MTHVRKVALVAVVGFALLVPGQKFKNCDALRVKYPSGVAMSVKSAGTTGAKVLKAIYTLNKGLDRDKDGIACEK